MKNEIAHMKILILKDKNGQKECFYKTNAHWIKYNFHLPCKTETAKVFWNKHQNNS